MIKRTFSNEYVSIILGETGHERGQTSREWALKNQPHLAKPAMGQVAFEIDLEEIDYLKLKREEFKCRTHFEIWGAQEFTVSHTTFKKAWKRAGGN